MTRRLTAVERQVLDNYTVIEKAGRQWRVVLRIDQQSFEIGPFRSDSNKHARWMQRQLAIALARMVAHETRGLA